MSSLESNHCTSALLRHLLFSVAPAVQKFKAQDFINCMQLAEFLVIFYHVKPVF